jgi:mannose-6-phosphate isomerase-like protein (cupin superfamily)
LLIPKLGFEDFSSIKRTNHDNVLQHDGRSAYSARPRTRVRYSFWYTGWLLTFLATDDQTQGQFALIDTHPQGQLPASSLHRNEDESFYILEGEITAWIGDQTIHGTPGTLIFGPRGVPHEQEWSTELEPKRFGQLKELLLSVRESRLAR